MEIEKRKKTNKTILIVFGVGFVGLLIFMFGMKLFVIDPQNERHAAEMAVKHTADSIENVKNQAAIEARKRAHEQRMKTDKRYRDSVNAAYRAEQKAAEAAAREEAKNGIGVSHSDIKAGLGALKWEETSNGIGFSQGGVTVAVNGPSSNATLVAVYIKADAALAEAQSAALALILNNAVGAKAAGKIMTDIGRMMQGRASGTEKTWTVGRNQVEFAYNPAQANLIVQIKPQ